MQITVSDLEEKVEQGIAKLGYVGDDAKVIAEVLMYAQLRGNNQGITKIATGGIPMANTVEAFRVVKTNKCGTLLAGGLGMVTASKAAIVAADLAEKHGVGIAGVNHTFTSTGAIGYYTRKIAQAGYIGLMTVGAPPVVAPFGSNEARLGTNPISYAFPTSSGPVIFDTTTAAMAYFGVVEAKLNGQQLPDGTAFDAEGRPTNDPAKALEGAVATLAGHKGYGLSIFAQMLGGPLVGGWFLGNRKEMGNGIFMMAIDPGLLHNKDEFLQAADMLTTQLKASRPATPGGRVYLPGESGDEKTAAHKAVNQIEIADAVWEELLAFVANNL